MSEHTPTYTMTKRPTVPAMEELLFNKTDMLDHGYLAVTDYMGDEAAILEAARVSYGAGTRTVNNAVGLLRYLMRHRHTTPMEMCEIKFQVKMPIFVARQWIRHRTVNINEESARYSIMRREFYLPTAEVLAAQSTTNKQGRGEVLLPEQANAVIDILREDASRNYDHYEELLNETAEGGVIDPNKTGIARELARMNLTLNTYTSLVWKVNAHNLMHFLGLRADPHAQYEIRVYAQRMLEILQVWLPNVADAFRDYRMEAVTLSSQEVHVLKNLLQKNMGVIDFTAALLDDKNISKRERDALVATFFPSV